MPFKGKADVSNLSAVVTELNGELRGLRRQNATIGLDFNHRPHLRILSLAPLVYDRYGIFRNKGPIVVAHLAVEALLTATHPGEEVGDVYAAVQANNDLYGFRLGVTALNSIAREVGRSDLAAFALAEIGE